MTHIFDVWNEVSRSLREVDNVYLGFDFDGTLAPIVEEPEAASIPQETGRILGEMAQFDEVKIAIFSGRSLKDLKERIKVDGLTLSGDHGFAIELSDGQLFRPNAVNTRENIQRQIARIEAITSTLAGIKLEPKESSVTVHYRQASDGMGKQLKSILEKLVEGSAFQLQSGRMCWEINPRAQWNKGKAYYWVKHQYFGENRNCFEMYVGDDRTDEDVFQAMLPGSFPVLVLSSERNGSTHARYYLNSQTEGYKLLDRINQELATRE